MDLAGHALLPALDMHVHINDGDGILQLAAGVTTVRDMGNDMEELLQRRRRFDAASCWGPGSSWPAWWTDPGPIPPDQGGGGRQRDGNRGGEPYADSGYVQLKIYSSVRPTLVRSSPQRPTAAECGSADTCPPS